MDFYSMENKKAQNTQAVPRISEVLLGCLLTTVLCLLKYLKVLNIDLEIVFAPFVVITLLVYGDKLLMGLFIVPIRLFSRADKKFEHPASSQKNPVDL